MFGFTKLQKKPTERNGSDSSFTFPDLDRALNRFSLEELFPDPKERESLMKEMEAERELDRG